MEFAWIGCGIFGEVSSILSGTGRLTLEEMVRAGFHDLPIFFPWGIGMATHLTVWPFSIRSLRLDLASLSIARQFLARKRSNPGLWTSRA